MLIYFKYHFLFGILLLSLTSVNAMQAHDAMEINLRQDLRQLPSASTSRSDTDYREEANIFSENVGNQFGGKSVESVMGCKAAFYDHTTGEQQSLFLKVKPLLKLKRFKKQERWKLLSMMTCMNPQYNEIFVTILNNYFVKGSKSNIQEFVLFSILSAPETRYSSNAKLLDKIIKLSKAESTLTDIDVVSAFRFIKGSVRTKVGSLKEAWKFVKNNYPLSQPLHCLLNYVRGYGLISAEHHPEVLILLPSQHNSAYCYRMCKQLAKFQKEELTFLIKRLNEVDENRMKTTNLEYVLYRLAEINSLDRAFIFGSVIPILADTRA